MQTRKRRLRRQTGKIGTELLDAKIKYSQNKILSRCIQKLASKYLREKRSDTLSNYRFFSVEKSIENHSDLSLPFDLFQSNVMYIFICIKIMRNREKCERCFSLRKGIHPGKIDVCSINVRILLGHVFIKTKRGAVAAGHCFSTHFLSPSPSRRQCVPAP